MPLYPKFHRIAAFLCGPLQNLRRSRGNITTPDGEAPVSLTLKADGATLTGTTTGPDGSETKIADGKIDGNNLSFSVTFDFGGMPLTIGYKGVLAGNQIKFTLDVFGMPMELVVKKT
jgi:hypothetical protein